MNRFHLAILRAGILALIAPSAATGIAQTGSGPFAGWMTNGAAVFRQYAQSTQSLPGPALGYPPPPTNVPVEIRRAMVMFRSMASVTILTNFSSVFDHFVPASLNYVVWTNFIAQTNGRNMVIWSTRHRPSNWPAAPPIARWNRSSLIWGMKGLTALSPAWSGEGPPGWAPITALTRRHGYTRGHGMGPERVAATFAGQKVWFLTAQNTLVETKVVREVVRTTAASNRDYTLLLFGTDLPDTIEPMRVVAVDKVFSLRPCPFPFAAGAPTLIFKTEQGGNVGADYPGFMVETMKGGDSGSPNMLPLPGELVFWTGRTTSGATPEMQADMDELCRLEGLDSKKYQIQFVDLSAYPKY